jgi:hypothetical protein
MPNRGNDIPRCGGEYQQFWRNFGYAHALLSANCGTTRQGKSDWDQSNHAEQRASLAKGHGIGPPKGFTTTGEIVRQIQQLSPD